MDIDSHEEAVDGGRDGSMGGTDTSHGAAVVGGGILGTDDGWESGMMASGCRVWVRV